MKTSYVVGPKGCGKTLNERLIASFLGCDAHGDIGTPFLAGYNAQHALVLTNEVPRTLYEGDSVYQFFHLRDLIARDPIARARWQDPKPEPDVELSPLEEERLKNFLADDGPIENMFAIGDLVHLISGGKPMIVSDVKGNVIECTWMDGYGRIQEDNFPDYWLTKHVIKLHLSASQAADLGGYAEFSNQLQAEIDANLGGAL